MNEVAETMKVAARLREVIAELSPDQRKAAKLPGPERDHWLKLRDTLKHGEKLTEKALADIRLTVDQLEKLLGDDQAGAA